MGAPKGRMRGMVEIEGLDRLTKNLDKFGGDLNEAMTEAVEKGAAMMRDAARRNVNSQTGELASGIISQLTWHKSGAYKVFAGVGISDEMDSEFRGVSKSGKKYYIPAAVEYGHRPPGGGGFTVLATDEEGNYKTYVRGKRKGRVKAAANKHQNKVSKPQRFMKRAFNTANKELARQIVADAIRDVVVRAGR